MTTEYTADMEDDYVKVANTEGSDLMEFPKEDDGTLMLSTIQSHFPNAIGLKYKAASGAWRGLRAVENMFDAPRGGWGSITYYVTESEAQKRKISDANGTTKKVFKSLANPLLQDMAVLGLPWTTTDEELKEYFELKCGELSYSEVKHEQGTGKSRGFGFIRFKTEDGAQEALRSEHFIGGRKVEVRQKKDNPMKLFIGRLPNGTTKEHLWEYFSKFGDLRDTYIPSPFRGFGFVTFSSSEVGNHVLEETHILQGARLNVDKGEESKSFNMKRGGGGGRDGGGRDGGGGGRGDSKYNNANQHNRTPQDSTTSTADPNVDLKTMLFAFLSNQN